MGKEVGMGEREMEATAIVQIADHSLYPPTPS